MKITKAQFKKLIESVIKEQSVDSSSDLKKIVKSAVRSHYGQINEDSIFYFIDSIFDAAKSKGVEIDQQTGSEIIREVLTKTFEKFVEEAVGEFEFRFEQR